MKRRATSSENRKLIVTVVACAFTIVKQMLTNGGFMEVWCFVNFACAGKALARAYGYRIGDGSWDVLFDSFFQTLRRATNVPTIAVAHKLIN